ncbi:MAG: ABC transporter substrate-binding protein [Lachnospiraceae bacterium]|nr:ABC transporter substrate-binding protein [Lachnospiraceae bacterium]MBR5766304.1 ABC transporter substrate-binding protein [Lachnospiraceae bacterium]MBR6469701.1 ABC transporter substrate-binding protein [Lachnospiraceae bacterium]MBR6485534.1 ABC transporter substrate-binding protein [Lachnospiraceae bacterium]
MKKMMALLLSVVMMMTLLTGCGGAAAGGSGSAGGTLTAYVLAEKGDTYSLGLANNFKTAFEANGGKVIMETFPTNTTNFSDYLQKSLDNKADVIFAPNSTTVAANLLANANDLGIECPIMAGDTWESSVILDAVKGTDLEVYCSTFFDESDSSSPAAKDFVAGFKDWLNNNSEYKDMNGGNDIVAAVSALGFDAYNVALAAIREAANEKGSDLTSIDIANALWGLSIDNAVTGKIQFDQNGDAIKDSAYIKKAGDGAFEFMKVQTSPNNAAQGTPADYGNATGVKLDTANKKIVIGVYEPTSGNNAAGGKQEVLGIYYANSLDDTVKIDGTDYKVELYVSDNGSLEENAVTAASNIVGQGALVSLGSYGSGVSIAAAQTFEDAGIPAIGVSCTNASVTEGHNYYFRTCFLDPFQGSVMAQFAWETVSK